MQDNNVKGESFADTLRSMLDGLRKRRGQLDSMIIGLETALALEQGVPVAKLDEHFAAPAAVTRRRGRPSATPSRSGAVVVSPGSFAAMSYKAAVRALLGAYPSGLRTAEVIEELRKRGVRAKGKSSLDKRIGMELSYLKSRGETLKVDGRHMLKPRPPMPAVAHHIAMPASGLVAVPVHAEVVR